MDSVGLLCKIIPELEYTRGVVQPKEHYWDVFNHCIKTPSNRGVSLSQSRRILVDVFEFSPKQIERMVGQYRAAKERLKDKDMTPEEKMQALNVDYFTNQELNQAQQQAHMITQGSPD